MCSVLFLVSEKITFLFCFGVCFFFGGGGCYFHTVNHVYFSAEKVQFALHLFFLN